MHHLCQSDSCVSLSHSMISRYIDRNTFIDLQWVWRSSLYVWSPSFQCDCGFRVLSLQFTGTIILQISLGLLLPLSYLLIHSITFYLCITFILLVIDRLNFQYSTFDPATAPATANKTHQEQVNFRCSHHAFLINLHTHILDYQQINAYHIKQLLNSFYFSFHQTEAKKN